MQVWNVLHAARWKCRTQKSRQKSPAEHHRTNLSGYIFATKAGIDNRQKTCLAAICPHGELRPTSGWDRLTSLGHPAKFQRLSSLGNVTARESSSGRQPNFAVLNRGRHLCSAKRPIMLGIGPHSSFSVFLVRCGRLSWLFVSVLGARLHNLS